MSRKISKNSLMCGSVEMIDGEFADLEPLAQTQPRLERSMRPDVIETIATGAATFHTLPFAIRDWLTTGPDIVQAWKSLFLWVLAIAAYFWVAVVAHADGSWVGVGFLYLCSALAWWWWASWDRTLEAGYPRWLFAIRDFEHANIRALARHNERRNQHLDELKLARSHERLRDIERLTRQRNIEREKGNIAKSRIRNDLL